MASSSGAGGGYGDGGDDGAGGYGDSAGGGCLAAYIDEGSVDSHRFFLARRTVLEMLSDRGCAVDRAQVELNLSDFRTTFGQNPDLDGLSITAPVAPDSSKKVVVVFCENETMKLTNVRPILERVSKEVSRLILVLQGKLTAQARAKLKEVTIFKVETFQITDLLVNITKHTLMPKHEVLNADEKKKLLKKYNIEESQLPRMLAKDAVARYYGLQKGQIVKVTYEGDLTSEHVTYRCVV